MQINKDDFDWAVTQGLLTTEQAETLWSAFLNRVGESDRPLRSQFTVANVAYYLGALIILASMFWLMSLIWETFGGSGLFMLAFLYGVLFALAGYILYFKQNLRIPGGLLFTIAVCMTPLAIYGLTQWLGSNFVGSAGQTRDLFDWFRESKFLMEIGTIIVGILTLRYVRFPFLVAPVAIAMYFLSQDVATVLYQADIVPSRVRAIVSMWFGISTIIIAYFVDRRTRRSEGDYAYWLYLVGLLSFWCSLLFLEGETELDRFLYFLTNIGLIVLSLLLKRRMFIVFGAIGVFGYLAYLARSVFENSLLFPVALTLLGLLIIFLGIQYQRHHIALEQRIESLLPRGFRRLLPKER